MRAKLCWMLVLSTIVLALTGCSGNAGKPTPVFRDVRMEIGERSQFNVLWSLDPKTCSVVEWRVEQLLSDEVTVNEAVQLAVYSNQRIQAIYEELGIAYAELVQAGLLKNPIFDISVIYSEKTVEDYVIEMGVVQNILDIFLTPLKKDLAKAELEHAKAMVTAEVLKTIAEVKKTYFTLQANMQIYDLWEDILHSADSAYDAAIRLHKAGNITDLELATNRSLYEQARLGMSRAENDVIQWREELNSMLGLWGRWTDYKVEDKLPEVPGQDISFDRLESLAVEKSLQLMMYKIQMYKVCRETDIEVTELFFNEMKAGVDSEREPDGTWFAGPKFEIGIPIFDWGQARRAKGRAMLRQLWDRYTASAIEIRSMARSLGVDYRKSLDQYKYYKDIMVPLAEQIMAETHLQYNAMQIGVFQLLQAKRQEIETRRDAIMAQLDFWFAQTELELLLNGGLAERAGMMSGNGSMVLSGNGGGH